MWRSSFVRYTAKWVLITNHSGNKENKGVQWPLITFPLFENYYFSGSVWKLHCRRKAWSSLQWQLQFSHFHQKVISVNYDFKFVFILKFVFLHCHNHTALTLPSSCWHKGKEWVWRKMSDLHEKKQRLFFFWLPLQGMHQWIISWFGFALTADAFPDPSFCNYPDFGPAHKNTTESPPVVSVTHCSWQFRVVSHPRTRPPSLKAAVSREPQFYLQGEE